MIEKQSEYLQKLPIELTVAYPVYTNGQTEETKHVEEASSSVCMDDEMFVDHSQQYLSVSLTYFWKVSSKASSWNVQIGIPILSAVNYNYSNDDIWYKKTEDGEG